MRVRSARLAYWRPKILTRENYIVTVPNAVVVSGKIINLSAESADGGVNLTTSVTIGYDTPWRQVHAAGAGGETHPGDRSANCAGGA
ncbi:mechanosensitive ion channel family protein [Klebsiella pneumoniae subsp. pneumoniae]|nr:mechanosensitive ion channel family protein [Klebsiella pneumoniae subsp. pneumoniae]